MNRPDLSLCLIVRDEAEMLPGLLASVDGLWDELVAVDTGSRDATMDLLRDAGARVLTEPWRDDFAAARNAGLAAATGRWILALDADERVTPGLVAEIRALLGDPEAGAATLVLRNELPDGHRRDASLLRLFRNDPSIRYRYRIHEDPSADVQAFLAREGLALRRLSGVVNHLGYVREVAAARDKRERDRDLLERLVREDPDDLYSWYKLMEQARFWNDRDLGTRTAPAAAEAFIRAPAAAVAGRPWSGELAALLAAALHGDGARGLAWLDEHADRAHPSAAWHLARGGRLEGLGRPEEAETAFRAAEAAARRPHSTVPPVRPLLGRSRLAVAAGDHARARELALAAAAEAPRDAEALLAAVTFSRLAGDTDAVAAFAADHGGTHPDAAEDLGRALLAGGEPALALDVLLALADEQPTAVLGAVVCALATGRDLDLRIDVDQATADAALRDWLRVLWRSRRTEWMTGVADRVPVVVEAFPWLPEFLQEETRRLRDALA